MAENKTRAKANNDTAPTAKGKTPGTQKQAGAAKGAKAPAKASKSSKKS